MQDKSSKRLMHCDKQGNLKKGVRIEKGKGLVKFVGLDEINLNALPSDLDPKNSDHIILSYSPYD